LKVTYKGKTYETTDFDHGFPPKEIQQFVAKIICYRRIIPKLMQPAMKIKEIQDEIVDEFSMFDDWMERLRIHY
jgi:transcription-repair coupling factor (superfamily II helicase)